MINHAWFGLNADLFTSLILKRWMILVKECSSDQIPLPTDV